MKHDALNALLMITLNGPTLGTPEANALLKCISEAYGKRKQYKTRPIARVNVTGTQTDDTVTQTIYIESEAMNEAEERLDAISFEKYSISNFTELSESESSEDEL